MPDLTFEDLVALLEVQDVYVSKTFGARLDDDDASEVTKPIWRGNWAEGEDSVLVTLGLSSTSPDVTYDVEATGHFRKTKPCWVGQSNLSRRFVQEVAAFTIWPYLRAEVSRVSTTLRVPTITLPFLNRGGLAVNHPDNDAPQDTPDAEHQPD